MCGTHRRVASSRARGGARNRARAPRRRVDDPRASRRGVAIARARARSERFDFDLKSSIATHPSD